MTHKDRNIGLEQKKITPTKMPGISYIFAIGIDKYHHIQPLNNAVNDVNALVGLLTAKYQFESTKVITLLNEKATRSNIHAQFRKLAQQITKNDSLLVYFSGHGTYDEVLDEGYWIPVEGARNDTSGYYSNREIIGALENIKSFHTLVISDSCFSGKLFTRSKHIPIEQRQESIPSRWALTSGRGELVSDGPPGSHSPLAQSLLVHLENNQEERLRISRLFDSVLEAVGSNYAQTPRCEPLQGVGHLGGEFVFRQKSVPEFLDKREPIIPGRPDNPSNPKIKIPRRYYGWIGIALVVLLGLYWGINKIKPNHNETTNGKEETVVVPTDEELCPTPDNDNPPDSIKKDTTPRSNPITKNKEKIIPETLPEDNLPIEPPKEPLYPIRFVTNGVPGLTVSFLDDSGKEYKITTNGSESYISFDIPGNLKNQIDVEVMFERSGRQIEKRRFDFSTNTSLVIPNTILNP